MWNIRTATLLLALGAALPAAGVGAASTRAVESLQSLYAEGSHYTAVLSQARQSWRLLSADGADIGVQAEGTGCAPTHALPTGVWLLTRDGDDRPALLAPSVTPLPNGHPELVAIRACGETGSGQPQVVAPQALIEWLANTTGAVYVAE